MIIAREIMGKTEDKRFAGKEIDWIDVPSFEATKRIMRRKTESGKEVYIELPRGSYLSHGAVIFDSDNYIVAIRRKPEEAMIIRFDGNSKTEILAEDIARVAHAFGNQHLPMEVFGLEIRIPITTSQSAMEHTLEHIELRVAEVSFTKVQFALDEMTKGGGHHEH